MAKFFTQVGFSTGTQEETSPGVWEDVIIEKDFYGDVLRNNRRLTPGENANNDLNAGNTFSIVANPYAQNHYYNIRYFRWVGIEWTVATVDATVLPRLNLTLGGVYNGPKPSAPADPSGDIDGESH